MKSKDILIIAILVILAITPIAYGFYYIDKYGVNLPQDDQWNTIVPWTIQYYEGTFNPGVLIQEQNDSRAVVTNIILIITSVLTRMNIKTIFFVGYLAYICSILLICYLVLKDLDSGSKKKSSYLYVLFLLPILYYAFNPYYLFRFIYNLGSLAAPMIAAAVLTIYLLDCSQKQNSQKTTYGYIIASVLMGFICTSSGAPGLSIWFAGIVQLSLQKGSDKIKKLLVWIIGAGITFYWYFFALGFQTQGIHSTEGYSAYLLTALTYPLNKFLCFLGVLGAEVIHDQDFALFFGGVLLAIFIALIYHNRKSLQFDKYSKWYSLLVFGTLTALELALLRSGSLQFSNFGSPDTIFYIPSIRHSLTYFLPIMCIYILALLYTKNSVDDTPQKEVNSIISRKEGNFLMLGMIFILMLCGTICHVLPGIAAADQSHDKNINGQYYLLNYKEASDAQLTQMNAVSFPQGMIREYAQKMEEYNLGVFSGSTDIELKLASVSPDEMVDSAGNNMRESYFTQSLNKKIWALSMPAIFEHPQGKGSIIIYKNYVIPDNSHLNFSIGIDDYVWNQPSSDGVTFEICIANPTIPTESTIFSKSINPAHNPEDQSWQFQSIDLNNFSDQRVNIELITRPNGNANYDWAWWGDPTLVSG